MSVPYIGGCRVIRVTWPWSYSSPCPPQNETTCSPDGSVHSGTQGGPAYGVRIVGIDVG